MAPRAWRPRSYSWQVAPSWPQAEELARVLGTAPLIAQILANRGVSDVDAARAFMNPSLNDLHDPELLPGCVRAAELIAQAVAQKRRIIIYGDYDVDGITAVAILHSCLRMIGAEAGYYVPHRLDEGYGVNSEAIGKLINEGAELLVTVDCGISAVGPLAEAAAAGLEVVVTDHHSPGEALPDVAAIVHPNLPGQQYPNANLAGAGVAFKLAWQIARTVCGNTRVDEPMREFLLNATSLAALGTIADVVPLVGENRSLAVHGLRALPSVKHAGLRALLESAGLADGKVDAYHVGFVLAPRINACGRMGHASLAVELLTDADQERSKEIAEYLAKQNTQRQKVQAEIANEAIEMVRSRHLDAPERRSIVLWSERWHGGVIGIVASRLVDEFSRPAILIAVGEDGRGQGSGRSIPGFHMRDALAACSEHLIGFGGHAMAGGLSIEPDKIDAFASALEDCARRSVTDEQLSPSLQVDAETTLGALSYKVAEHIARLAPFGQGNPQPLVAIRGCQVLVGPKRMGRGGGTAGMTLQQNGTRMRAVGFGMGDLADHLAGIDTVDVVAQPTLNTFNGRTSVELKLKDVRW